MDKMKKLLSPKVKHKNLPQPSSLLPSGLSGSEYLGTPRNYFGIPLSQILQQEGTKVPLLVTKICHYVYKHGMSHEGIFRVNGSARVIERLRESFDVTGTANFDDLEPGDITAVAGLLKRFLRELPQSVIPETMTGEFVQTQLECVLDVNECVRRLRPLTRGLEMMRYDLLKYLCYFLCVVTKYQAQNQMTSKAIAIVFGPTIFSFTDEKRCAVGFEGLQQQGITNQVINHFILKYDDIFLEEGELSPYSNHNIQIPQIVKRPAPPRPAPPKLDGTNTAPVPSPRKSFGKTDLDNNLAQSASNSDDEYLDTYRSEASFALSDRSEIYGNSFNSTLTMSTPALSDTVKQAISTTVSQFIFGESDKSSSPDDDTNNGPIPAPRKRRKNKAQAPTPDHDRMDRPSTESSSIQHRINMFDKRTDSGSTQAPVTNSASTNQGKLHKQRPKSDAFEMFEKKGIIISPAVNLGKMKPSHSEAELILDMADTNDSEITRPKPKPRSPKKQQKPYSTSTQDLGLDLDLMEEQPQTLTSFKRPAGPKNRRSPSRRPKSAVIESTHSTTPANTNNYSHDTDSDSDSRVCEDTEMKRCQNHEFMNLHHPHITTTHVQNGDTVRGSDESKTSSDGGKKPFIPPLDLSILHEHCEGNEPLVSDHGLSQLSHQTKVVPTVEPVLISPRQSKLKKKHNTFFAEEAPLSPSAFHLTPYNSAIHNTDVPPSPPTEHIIPKSISKDESQAQIKSITKKLQACKKKIKHFEESFEKSQGYRPSQADKANDPDIKKCIQDLSKARRDLRRLKEERDHPEQAFSPIETLGLYETETLQNDDGNAISDMKITLHTLQDKLHEKRLEANRSEELAILTREEVYAEKVAVQKVLLTFENIHGRPTGKAEKDLMKPLYDRYRTIKRLLARPVSPREKLKDLATVPEDLPIEFSPTSSAKSSNRDVIHIPTATSMTSGARPLPDLRHDQVEDGTHGELGAELMTSDFIVTRDFGIMNINSKPSSTNHNPVAKSRSTNQPYANERVINQNTMLPGYHDDDVMDPLDTLDTHLEHSEGTAPLPIDPAIHQRTLPELLAEQQTAKSDKKRLRKVLREFEDDFARSNGRKVTKDDRMPMDQEYHEYKQVKARLKLLDALLSKHYHT